MSYSWKRGRRIVNHKARIPWRVLPTFFHSNATLQMSHFNFHTHYWVAFKKALYTTLVNINLTGTRWSVSFSQIEVSGVAVTISGLRVGHKNNSNNGIILFFQHWTKPHMIELFQIWVPYSLIFLIYGRFWEVNGIRGQKTLFM